MADWLKPTLTSLYTEVLSEIHNKSVDAGTMFLNTPTNPPAGSMKWDRVGLKLQEWNGSTFVDRVLSIAGGGTGATSLSGISSALGLGTMSVQNANTVAITGGTATGLTTFTVSGDILPTSDNTRAIGSNALQFNKAYIKTGFKIPVGSNMYLTS